jgi:ribosome silencing factor RsfS/YbeB/iojap
VAAAPVVTVRLEGTLVAAAGLRAAGARVVAALRAAGRAAVDFFAAAAVPAVSFFAADGRLAAVGRKAAVAPRAPVGTRRARTQVPAAEAAALRLQQVVRDALDDLKARDVTEIDVKGKSSVTDLLVIASGTSSRHVKSIADEVIRKAKQAGMPPIGVEGQREAEWVLVDLGDIVVHVMQPRTRDFYGLERMWGLGGDDEAEVEAAVATLAG